MKKILLLFFGLLLAKPCFASQEIINSFESIIEVREDGSLLVEETISLEAYWQQIKLGIYRDFPKYRTDLNSGGRIAQKVEVLEVLKDGRPENFWVETYNGNNRLQIGPARDEHHNRLTPGSHTYLIRYIISDQVSGFKDHDEVYFNITGAWNFPILKARAVVSLPENINILNIYGYTGLKGSKGSNYEAGFNANQAKFITVNPLASNEEFTVAVAFAKGHIIPSQAGSASNYRLYMPVGAVLLMLVYYLLMWCRFGKDHPLGAIVPLFYLPENISLSEAAALTCPKGSYSKAAVAGIISLASQGFLKIKDDRYGLITLIKTEHEKLPPNKEEEILFKHLFSKYNHTELDKTYNQDLSAAYAKYQERLKSIRKYHINENRLIMIIGISLTLVLSIAVGALVSWSIPIMFGLCLFYSPFFLSAAALLRQKALAGLLMLCFITPHFGAFITTLPFAIISASNPESAISIYVVSLAFVLFMVVLNFVFSRLMDKPSLEAADKISKIEGVKLYIKQVETNRFKKLPPDVFEKNLPFAIMAGLEKEWLRKFGNFDYIPKWYEGSRFNIISFNNLQSSFSSSTHKPSSRSGGGFGGGSSGGGGGSSGGGGR